MKNLGITVLLAVVALSGLSGCASIISGSGQEVTISSSPSDAKIVVYKNQDIRVWESRTPSAALLKRGDGYFSPARYRVEVSKEGYQPKTVEMSYSINGWYIGNILFGGLIGVLIVDPLTGAMWHVTPSPLHIELEPIPPMLESPPDSEQPMASKPYPM